MELYDVMRTILDNARFAPNGGNRQATHVTVVRDATVRQRLGELNVTGARRYFAQLAAGESRGTRSRRPAPPEGLMESAMELANRLASMPPVSVENIKRLVYQAINPSQRRLSLVIEATTPAMRRRRAVIGQHGLSKDHLERWLLVTRDDDRRTPPRTRPRCLSVRILVRALMLRDRNRC